MISSTTPVEMPGFDRGVAQLGPGEVAIDQRGDHQRVQRRHHATSVGRGDAEAQEHDDQHRQQQRRAGACQLAQNAGHAKRVAIGKPRRRPARQHTAMKPAHISRPGRMPATNSAPGSTRPTPARRRSSGSTAGSGCRWWRRQRGGREGRRVAELLQPGISIEPMAPTASATAEPDTPPKIVDDSTPTCAGPPCIAADHHRQQVHEACLSFRR